jgi:hypothetical protein
VLELLAYCTSDTCENEDVPEIATTTSLIAGVVVLAMTVIASLLRSRTDRDARRAPNGR